ncbi:pancreatic secretory granule membrane major glycoprotein GP2-like [Mizuhopecten yessoensis]|uniref:pancreatic secretory granule membrane major glycoprotein GP2-like n=1 Tax=Mizuhopecten yessoensis TaxID=6573 RepID=UPI000B45C036|nr:pancreatic secretory granule membrane major glycoprotein GP2-like [Mizuhopecten yessoensis]
MATSMSCILSFLVILMYVLPSESSAVSDPCVSHERIHKGKYRGTKCNYRLGKAVNDRYIKDSMWYIAVGSNGPLSMPTFPVNVDECSTKLPIWMNGTHPDTGVTVNRTACMTGPTMKCQEEYKIQVKNCSAFNVYKLQKTTGLEMAYCFGKKRENVPCPPTD